jgi:hypothetical protein
VGGGFHLKLDVETTMGTNTGYVGGCEVAARMGAEREGVTSAVVR